MTTVLRRLAARADRAGSDDAGFTVLEVVVSFVLFAIVATAATTAVLSATKTSHSSQQRVQAADIAQQDIAQAVAAYNAGTVPQGTTYTARSGAEAFKVTRTVGFVGSATACSSGNSFRIHVGVQSSGSLLAQSDTVVAC